VRLATLIRAAFVPARVVSAAVVITLSLAGSSSASSAGAQNLFPVGVVNASEPSGVAPPLANAMPGYQLSYVNDFNQPGLPHGWSVFSGHPGGLPTAHFSGKHVVTSQGMLQLLTYRDPDFANQWTTGGLCQCQFPVKYGAFFVRSRVTGLGANSVELLWPWNNAAWPPEVDFNENLNHLNLTTSTTHFGAANSEDFDILRINMRKWHTWGVIWTPQYLLFVVDGHPWHELSIDSEVPAIPLTLDFEQRALCPSSTECPTQPSALQIDWVAVYQPQSAS
jgi:hypothetical protein